MLPREGGESCTSRYGRNAYRSKARGKEKEREKDRGRAVVEEEAAELVGLRFAVEKKRAREGRTGRERSDEDKE